MEVMALQVKYPQGAEKNLIKAVTGKEVPSGKLPLEVGVINANVGTCLSIYEAVVLNKPVIETGCYRVRRSHKKSLQPRKPGSVPPSGL